MQFTDQGHIRALGLALASDILDLVLPPKSLKRIPPIPPLPFPPPHEIASAIFDGVTQAGIEFFTGKPSIWRELMEIPEELLPKFPSHTIGTLLSIVEPKR